MSRIKDLKAVIRSVKKLSQSAPPPEPGPTPEPVQLLESHRGVPLEDPHPWEPEEGARPAQPAQPAQLLVQQPAANGDGGDADAELAAAISLSLADGADAGEGAGVGLQARPVTAAVADGAAEQEQIARALQQVLRQSAPPAMRHVAADSLTCANSCRRAYKMIRSSALRVERSLQRHGRFRKTSGNSRKWRGSCECATAFLSLRFHSADCLVSLPFFR